MALKHTLEDDSEPRNIKKSKLSGTTIPEAPIIQRKSATTTSVPSGTKSIAMSTGQPTQQTPETNVEHESEIAPQTTLTTAADHDAVPQSVEAATLPEVTKRDAKPELKGSDILPLHLAHLTQKYRFATIAIKSHSKINKKVIAMVGHMSRFDFLDPDYKPGIVVLDARSSDANKLITVIEIVKKDIFENERSGKWYQYNRVSSEMTQIPRTASKKELKTTTDPSSANEEDLMDMDPVEDDITGTDERQTPPETKSRAIPVLTIYMSRVPIPELRAELGEQNNEKDIIKWWEPLPLTIPY